MAFRAIITEIAFHLKIPGNTWIFYSRVRVYCGLGKFVDIILDEGCVKSETTDQLVLETTLVHQPNVYISTQQRIIVYIDNDLLQLLLASTFM